MSLLVIMLCVIAIIVLYAGIKLKLANNEVSRILKEKAQLETQKKQLEQDNVIVKTQNHHYEVRKQHEENAHSANRQSIVDSLQSTGDFRD